MSQRFATVTLEKIIGKTELFSYVMNSEISHVSLYENRNKNFTNPDVCKIKIYLKVDFLDFSNMVGLCAIHFQTLKGETLLGGIASSKINSTIKSSTIRKLREIEQKHNIKLCIPEKWDELIEKYENNEKIEN